MLSKLRLKILILQAILLVIQLVVAIFSLKILSICLMVVILILTFLGVYTDYHLKQVRYFCLVRGELLLNGKFKEADELYNSLTNFQKYLFKEMKQ